MTTEPMDPKDVPDELVDLAMTGAAPGCRGDAAFYLANVLPAHEAMVLRDREMVVYAHLVEAAIADRMPEIERKIRAEVATEIKAAGKNIVREPHCIMPGLWKQWERAAEIARGEV